MVVRVKFLILCVFWGVCRLIWEVFDFFVRGAFWCLSKFFKDRWHFFKTSLSKDQDQDDFSRLGELLESWWFLIFIFSVVPKIFRGRLPRSRLRYFSLILGQALFSFFDQAPLKFFTELTVFDFWSNPFKKIEALGLTF